MYVLGASLVGYIGFKIFNYATYSSAPEFSVVGLDEGASYKDELRFSIKADNGYKIANLKIVLDGKPLNGEVTRKVGSSRFETAYVIDTKVLGDGPHQMEIEARDASYQANMSRQTRAFKVDNMPLSAAFLSTEYKVDQGRTVHAQIQANKTLKSVKGTFLSRVYDFVPESPHSMRYEAFIPVDCEERPQEDMLAVEVEDATGGRTNLSSKVVIREFKFKQASGFSVAQQKLDEEREVSISDKVFEQALGQWLAQSPKEKLWTGSFENPMQISRIVTPYGEIRATAEKGRYLHKAVDLVNMPRSVVWASQKGKVIIKERYHLSGNTVVLDHGLGIFTLYYHLEDFAHIEVGDVVNKGAPLGKVGKTGYASGYHLHWELRVNNVAVDPLQWTEKTF
jgi:murein DD-endopeptidase MepM/ murein hydrolase activator NlpD